MIEGKTVFILGAGASVPYGYPTGKGLREKICHEFSNKLKDIEWKSNIQPRKEIWLAKAEIFSTKFYDSSNESIDLFLARNPDFSDIGKLAIILSIFDYESESKFRESRQNDGQDWYQLYF